MDTAAEKLTYWRAFGDRRFTKNDLWRTFGSGSWPTPDFLASLGLEQFDWIEPAPGPRGGAGWKMTAAAAAQMRKKEEKQTARQASVAEIAARVAVAVGAVRVEPSYQKNKKDQIIWWYWPPIAIEGRNVDGRRRAPSDAFTLSFPSGSEFDAVQREVDDAVRHVMQLAIEQREVLVKQIDVLTELTRSIESESACSTAESMKQ